jgi:hypothetical protein
VELISEDELDNLRIIANNLRDMGGQVTYGYFPGGDPREFTPDEESCTPNEIEAWKLACELVESGEVKLVSGQHHWPVFDKLGVCIGHTTHSPFGIGTYTYNDPVVVGLANKLDAWIDDVRKAEEAYL